MSNLSNLINKFERKPGYNTLNGVYITGTELKELSDLMKSQPKVYRALLTQSGTDAPVATVLENTIGDIVWSRLGTGIYNGTLAGAFPDNNKVFILTSLRSSDNDNNVIILSSIESNDIIYTTFIANYVDGAAISIEILVYP